MADPFDTPGDAQAGAGQSCPRCGGYGRVPRGEPGARSDWVICPACGGTGKPATKEQAVLESAKAGPVAAPALTDITQPGTVAGPLTPLFRTALRNLVTDTLSRQRFVGVEDVAFADLHRLAAAVGPLVAGWKVWNRLGVTIRPDFAEFWALRLESMVDKEAVATVISRELLALVQPLVEEAGPALAAAPLAPTTAPHLLGEAARCPVPRSPHWPAVRDKWLREHPNCTACDATDGVEVHHCEPVHMRPERELDPTNFLSLCRPRSCHFRAHGYDWTAMTPTARQDAAHQLKLARGRLYALPDAPAT